MYGEKLALKTYAETSGSGKDLEELLRLSITNVDETVLR